MIYDCFTFFNELDVLELRLNILKDVVDKFVFIEAGETHTGNPKPFYFEENKARFSMFLDRIIYHKIDRFPSGHSAWWNENYQRNALTDVLRQLYVNDGDDVLISDLDEIPNPAMVARYRGTSGVKAFHQKFYSYYLNYQDLTTLGACTTKMMPYSVFCHAFDGVKTYGNEFLSADINEGTTATKIRRRAIPCSAGGEIRIHNGGWHFTCIGGAKAMVAKMHAVAPHHDFDPNDPSLTEERLAKLIAEGKGPALKMSCFAVPLDASFPRYVLENQDKLTKLIFPISAEYLRRVRVQRFRALACGRIRQFCEWICPSVVHNRLHLIKMSIIKHKEA